MQFFPISVQDTDLQTDPPPSSTFSQTVNQWVIYDSYVQYEYQKELQDEQERLAKLCDPKRALKRMLVDRHVDDQSKLEETFLRAARTLERMVVQNIYTDIAIGAKIKQSIPN